MSRLPGFFNPRWEWHGHVPKNRPALATLAQEIATCLLRVQGEAIPLENW
jgi:hypothetical protein